MKRLLLVLLVFFMMKPVLWADQKTQTLLDKQITELRVRTLMYNLKNHPDAVLMGDNWYRMVKKENISDTKFDWRFDMRMIDISASSLAIGHRMEQNSGSTPNSNWVVEYQYIDKKGDGVLDSYDKDRFISVNTGGDAWYRTSPRWPDGHRYGDILTEKEAYVLFDKELTFWENILK